MSPNYTNDELSFGQPCRFALEMLSQHADVPDIRFAASRGRPMIFGFDVLLSMPFSPEDACEAGIQPAKRLRMTTALDFRAAAPPLRPQSAAHLFHMTKPKIVVLLLSIVSGAAITFAFLYRAMAGIFLYDSNFETFHSVLTDDQKRGITWSLDSITSAYSWLLTITNVLWIIGAWYLLSRLKAAPQERLDEER